MDLFFPPNEQARLEFKQSALQSGFEELAAECTSNLHFMPTNDRQAVIVLSWSLIGDYLTQRQYTPSVGKTVSWVGRYTLELWFGRDWTTFPEQNKTSLIENMMKVYPAAYISMHPYPWPYMFAIYRDPWMVDYLNVNFQRMNGPDTPESLETIDTEFIKKEGISLILLRLINLFDFGMIKLVLHICLRLLWVWDDPIASASIRSTPNAAEYIGYARHIYLIAVCESGGDSDLHYMLECIQQFLFCNYPLTASKLDKSAYTIAKGIKETCNTLTEFLNGFLQKVPDTCSTNIFGSAVAKYVAFITRYQIESLHSMDSIEIFLPSLYTKLLQMFIKQRQSSDELMKTTAAISERLFTGALPLKALKCAYEQVKELTRPEWYTTKVTILLSIISEELNELEDLKYMDDIEVDALITKEQQLALMYSDLSKLFVKVPYLEQEAWLTAFSLHPCKEYMEQVTKCGSRNLRAIKKQSSKFNPEPKPLAIENYIKNENVESLSEEHKVKELILNQTLTEKPDEKINPPLASEPVTVPEMVDSPTTSAAFLASLASQVLQKPIEDNATVVTSVVENKPKKRGPRPGSTRKPKVIEENAGGPIPVVEKIPKKRGPRPKGSKPDEIQNNATKRVRPRPKAKDVKLTKEERALKLLCIKPIIANPDAKDKDSAEVMYSAAAGASDRVPSQTAVTIKYPAFALINSVTDTEDLMKFTDYDDEISSQYEELYRIMSNLQLLNNGYDDMLALIIAPRYKRLTWTICWKILRKRCRELLTKESKKKQLVQQYMADANERLTHLYIDYDKYKDKPQIDYGTIEIGYECFDTDSADDTPTKSDQKPDKVKGKPGRAKKIKLTTPTIPLQETNIGPLTSISSHLLLSQAKPSSQLLPYQLLPSQPQLSQLMLSQLLTSQPISSHPLLPQPLMFQKLSSQPVSSQPLTPEKVSTNKSRSRKSAHPTLIASQRPIVGLQQPTPLPSHLMSLPSKSRASTSSQESANVRKDLPPRQEFPKTNTSIIMSRWSYQPPPSKHQSFQSSPPNPKVSTSGQEEITRTKPQSGTSIDSRKASTSSKAGVISEEIYLSNEETLSSDSFEENCRKEIARQAALSQKLNPQPNLPSKRSGDEPEDLTMPRMNPININKTETLSGTGVEDGIKPFAPITQIPSIPLDVKPLHLDCTKIGVEATKVVVEYVYRIEQTTRSTPVPISFQLQRQNTLAAEDIITAPIAEDEVKVPTESVSCISSINAGPSQLLKRLLLEGRPQISTPVVSKVATSTLATAESGKLSSDTITQVEHQTTTLAVHSSKQIIAECKPPCEIVVSSLRFGSQSSVTTPDEQPIDTGDSSNIKDDLSAASIPTLNEASGSPTKRTAQPSPKLKVDELILTSAVANETLNTTTGTIAIPDVPTIVEEESKPNVFKLMEYNEENSKSTGQPSLKSGVDELVLLPAVGNQRLKATTGTLSVIDAQETVEPTTDIFASKLLEADDLQSVIKTINVVEPTYGETQNAKTGSLVPTTDPFVSKVLESEDHLKSETSNDVQGSLKLEDVKLGSAHAVANESHRITTESVAAVGQSIDQLLPNVLESEDHHKEKEGKEVQPSSKLDDVKFGSTHAVANENHRITTESVAVVGQSIDPLLPKVLKSEDHHKDKEGKEVQPSSKLDDVKFGSTHAVASENHRITTDSVAIAEQSIDPLLSKVLESNHHQSVVNTTTTAEPSSRLDVEEFCSTPAFANESPKVTSDTLDIIEKTIEPLLSEESNDHQSLTNTTKTVEDSSKLELEKLVSSPVVTGNESPIATADATAVNDALAEQTIEPFVLKGFQSDDHQTHSQAIADASVLSASDDQERMPTISYQRPPSLSSLAAAQAPSSSQVFVQQSGNLEKTPKKTCSPVSNDSSSSIATDDHILHDDGKVFNNNLLDPRLKTYHNKGSFRLKKANTLDGVTSTRSRVNRNVKNSRSAKKQTDSSEEKCIVEIPKEHEFLEESDLPGDIIMQRFDFFREKYYEERHRFVTLMNECPNPDIAIVMIVRLDGTPNYAMPSFDGLQMAVENSVQSATDQTGKDSMGTVIKCTFSGYARDTGQETVDSDVALERFTRLERQLKSPMLYSPVISLKKLNNGTLLNDFRDNREWQEIGRLYGCKPPEVVDDTYEENQQILEGEQRIENQEDELIIEGHLLIGNEHPIPNDHLIKKTQLTEDDDRKEAEQLIEGEAMIETDKLMEETQMNKQIIEGHDLMENGQQKQNEELKECENLIKKVNVMEKEQLTEFGQNIEIKELEGKLLNESDRVLKGEQLFKKSELMEREQLIKAEQLATGDELIESNKQMPDEQLIESEQLMEEEHLMEGEQLIEEDEIMKQLTVSKQLEKIEEILKNENQFGGEQQNEDEQIMEDEPLMECDQPVNDDETIAENQIMSGYQLIECDEIVEGEQHMETITENKEKAACGENVKYEIKTDDTNADDDHKELHGKVLSIITKAEEQLDADVKPKEINTQMDAELGTIEEYEQFEDAATLTSLKQYEVDVALDVNTQQLEESSDSPGPKQAFIFGQTLEMIEEDIDDVYECVTLSRSTANDSDVDYVPNRTRQRLVKPMRLRCVSRHYLANDSSSCSSTPTPRPSRRKRVFAKKSAFESEYHVRRASARSLASSISPQPQRRRSSRQNLAICKGSTFNGGTNFCGLTPLEKALFVRNKCIELNVCIQKLSVSEAKLCRQPIIKIKRLPIAEFIKSVHLAIDEEDKQSILFEEDVDAAMAEDPLSVRHLSPAMELIEFEAENEDNIDESMISRPESDIDDNNAECDEYVLATSRPRRGIRY